MEKMNWLTTTNTIQASLSKPSRAQNGYGPATIDMDNGRLLPTLTTPLNVPAYSHLDTHTHTEQTPSCKALSIPSTQAIMI